MQNLKPMVFRKIFWLSLGIQVKNNLSSFIYLIFILLLPGHLSGQGANENEAGKILHPKNNSWTSVTTTAEVCQQYPDKIERLFQALDLDRAGLEEVKNAYQLGNLPAACKALVAYYKEPDTQKWVKDQVGELTLSADQKNTADKVLADSIRSHQKYDKIPKQNGAWNWNHGGPNDYREWAFSLNRHNFFEHLMMAYRETGKEQYARKFDKLVRDWVIHVPCPGNEHAYTYTWRVLEAGLRMRSWIPAFYGFQQANGFSPAGRLLMLSSIAEHAPYIRQHHWDHHNHALMELDGLNYLALAFPEFKQSESWHVHAMSGMLEEMDFQVLPDGAHDELASSYHWVSLNSFERLATTCRRAGVKVPKAYKKGLVDMYNYLAWLLRPDGSAPMNNRSDRKNFKDQTIKAAKTYNRPEWEYITTNGKRGEEPTGQPSRFNPYAGQLISRSSWGKGAHWSFFDAGPAGEGWVHRDKLHLSITAFGQDFLVDAGKFWYERDEWNAYAHASRAHNVIHIDGHPQETGQRKAEKPYDRTHYGITEVLDYTRSQIDTFKNLDGRAIHNRTVVYLRNRGWVVLDHLTSDRPRELTAFWHFHPDCKVKLGGKKRLSAQNQHGATMQVVPVGPVDWQVEKIKGQKSPRIQGWYCAQSPQWVPNICATYNVDAKKEAVFAWIFWPSENGKLKIANPEINYDQEQAVVSFNPEKGQNVHLTIPFNEGAPKLGK